MKIAVLSDIHGNHIAAKAVIDSIKTLGISKIIFLGDLVGYYYHPFEVVELFGLFDVSSIRGNHERFLLKAIENEEYKKFIKTRYGSGISRAIETLPESYIQFLKTLPDQKEININNIRILMNHGSPWNQDEYIYPDAKPKILELFKNYNYDLILLGHTHYQDLSHIENKYILNPGSVGQSRVKGEGGVASWATIDFTKSKIEIDLHKTKYNTNSIINEVKEVDPEIEYLHQVLTR